MVKTVLVKIWGFEVGVVNWKEKDNVGEFQFFPEFKRRELDLAPVQMSIQDRSTLFTFKELASKDNYECFHGLPGLLADVLPDKYGKSLINAWLTQNNRVENSMNPVEMLSFTGSRAMGALEFEPAVLDGSTKSQRVEIDSMVNMVNKIMEKKEKFRATLSKDDDEKNKEALLKILMVGSSAGGARAKALIAYNPVTGEVRTGQGDTPAGFSQWLLKFDGVEDTQINLGVSGGYGRIEMAYHKMAVDCGIEMTECRLKEENNRAHFMTRRFDRPDDGSKLHYQSLCGLCHYNFNRIGVYSYEGIFQTMRALKMPYEEGEQLFRRMVFNVVASNCDDHTKNVGFLMDRKGVWKLAPAFDLSYSYKEDSIWVKEQSMTVNGKRNEITGDDLVKVGNFVGIESPDKIIAEITGIVGGWKRYAKSQGVHTDHLQQIQNRLNQVRTFL